MTDFWQRMKQRKLVQWALAYVAGAFALLQGVDIVAERFGWPAGIERGLIIVACIGFFVALVLAWYHGERGAQRVTGMEVIVLAVLLGIGGGLLWRFSGSLSASNTPSAAQAPPPVGQSSSAMASSFQSRPAIPEKSVAVLPFNNDSGDPQQQYFSDGLSQDLIIALNQFRGLKVISRDSSFQFRHSKLDPRIIARQLGVAHLLEGSVQKQGDQVRVSVTLVNAADGSSLWSQRYDKAYRDLFKLQDDITHAVAEALKAKLLGAVVQSDRPPSGSLAAYEAYLKGNAQPYTEAGDQRAIALYAEAVRIDPDYARSHAALSMRWADLGLVYADTRGKQRQGIKRARAAADTALRLAPNLLAGHYARGLILLGVELDWQGARDEANTMAALAPDALDSIDLRARVLRVMGQPRHAEMLDRKAITLDPLNAKRYRNLAYDLDGQWQYDASVAVWRKAIELEPGRAPLHARLALAELSRGDRTDAVAAAKLVPPGFWHDFARAALLLTGSDRPSADAVLKSMADKYADTASYQIAELYALRKDPDGMFHWLDRAWNNRDAGIQYLLIDPILLRYKDDPRFAAYCRKVGLPVPGRQDRHD